MPIRNRRTFAAAGITVACLFTAGWQIHASGDRKEPVEPAVIVSEYGKGEGSVGDTMHTAFLEFTVNRADTAEE